MTHFKVLEVLDVNEWSGQHGVMFDFTLSVEDDSGSRTKIKLNAKTAATYKAGSVFWATPTGKEHRGVGKWKRVADKDAPQSSGNGAPSPVAAQTGFMLGGGTPKPAAMPYALAIELTARLAAEVNPEYGAQLLGAILRGEVESPLKPKFTVVYMGNTLETAGITQETWDLLMPLCDEMERETDRANLRALLIATCGVQTRKDLTEAKAKLFIATLQTNLAAIRATMAPPPDDSDQP